MREWLSRLRDWFRRDQLDRELTEELRFHQALLERDARGQGAGTAEAPDLARRRLGSPLRVRAAPNPAQMPSRSRTASSCSASSTG